MKSLRTKSLSKLDVIISTPIFQKFRQKGTHLEWSLPHTPNLEKGTQHFSLLYKYPPPLPGRDSLSLLKSASPPISDKGQHKACICSVPFSRAANTDGCLRPLLPLCCQQSHRQCLLLFHKSSLRSILFQKSFIFHERSLVWQPGTGKWKEKITVF